MRTFTIQLPLVPLATGQVIDRAAWTAHITLVGNFRAHDDAAIVEVVDRFAARTPALQVAVEQEAWFGPDRTTLVDLVEVPLLRALHAELLGDLELEVPGLEMILPLHSREGYWPHRTVNAGPRPSPGDVVSVEQIALAELEPAGRPGEAVILGIWALGASLQLNNHSHRSHECQALRAQVRESRGAGGSTRCFARPDGVPPPSCT